MPLAQLENIRLYYEEHGHGPALILAHGHACGVRSWDPQVRGLADRYRVVVYDARGHGLSEAPNEASAYSQQHMVDDLCGLMDHLNLVTAALGGLSMGGNVVLNFAFAHPERATRELVSGQPPDHQAIHRRVDERLAGGAQSLVVSAEAAVLTEPGEGALDHPPPRQHTAEDLRTRWQPLPAEPDRLNPGEIAMRNPLAARMWRMPNDLYPPAVFLLDPGLATTRVPLIYPEMLNARE